MFLNSALILCWLGVLVLTCRAWSRLQETTLTTACAWGMGAACVGLIAAVTHASVSSDRTGWSDLAWYATAVTLLCPGVAVLGARRPGAAAWGFFVLLPLLAVMAWPAATASRVISDGVPLEFETPAIAGFGVVLIMAFGNWIGTRFTLPAFLYAVSILLLVVPMSSLDMPALPDRPVSQLLSALLVFAAAGIGSGRASGTFPHADAFNSLWFDFVDTFGMVWAKRVMDRLNQSAAHEKWSATLDWHGFVWQTDCSEDDIRRTRERIEHTLRWLLKRFVEPSWIDRRLESHDDTDDE